jgi:hypothetical protein
MLTLMMAVLGLTAALGAQAPVVPARSFDALRTGVRQAANGAEILELRLRWSASSATDRDGRSRTFTLTNRRVAVGRLRNERRPELSADRLVVVSLDEAGRELDWRLVPNPRIVRLEAPGANGLLTGRTIEQDVLDLEVAVARLPGLRLLRIYQPRWSGTEYLLDLVGAFDLGAAQ